MYTLDMDIKASRILTLLFALMHFLAALIVLVIWMDWHAANLMIFMAFLVIALSAWHCVTQYARLSNQKAWVGLFWDPHSACWLLQNRQKKVYSARLLSDSIITTSFLLLNFKIEGWFFTTTVLLTTDNSDNNHLRQCRVLIKNGYATRQYRRTISRACQERQ